MTKIFQNAIPDMETSTKNSVHRKPWEELFPTWGAVLVFHPSQASSHLQNHSQAIPKIHPCSWSLIPRGQIPTARNVPDGETYV